MIAICFYLFYFITGIYHKTCQTTIDVVITTEALMLVWPLHTKQNVRHNPAPIRKFSNNLYLLIQQLQNSMS